MFDRQADPYAGYLHDLLVHYQGKMPLMITEFGVPSSLGSAHIGTLGRSQGDHTEQLPSWPGAPTLYVRRVHGNHYQALGPAPAEVATTPAPPPAGG